MEKEYIEKHWDSVTIPTINWPALRAFLTRKCPFYTQALQMVNIEVVDHIKTSKAIGYTNGYKVAINPRVFMINEIWASENKKPWFKTPELGIAFVILHEVGHIIFDTFGREGMRQPELWNVATDFQINQFVVKLMKESGMFSSEQAYKDFLAVVNAHFLFDPARYERLSAEMTYDDLYRIRVGGGSGGAGGNGGLAGDLVKEDESSMTDQQRMDRDITKSEMSNYVGKNAKHLTPGVGSCFREFEFMLEPPKVNLKMVLRQINDKDTSDDWGYTNRGSRMDHLLRDGMRLPVITQTNPDLVRKVFFILDSSGSMSDEQLNDAMNTVKECLERYTRQPVYLIIHTSDIVFSKDIRSHNEVVEKFSGGTAFWPVIEEIKRIKDEEHIIPSAVIWLTDYYGEVDFQPRDLPFPPKKMKWIISGSSAEPSTGQTFYIDEV